MAPYIEFISTLKQCPTVSMTHYLSRLCDAVRDILAGRLLNCAQLSLLMDQLTLTVQKGFTSPPHETPSQADQDLHALFETTLASRRRASFITKSLIGESSISVKEIKSNLPSRNSMIPAPFGHIFSTARVELLVSLYSNIVDSVNFNQVLGALSYLERAMLIFRLGYLNLWNPLKPEGYYALSLNRREERMIAKMLFVLAKAEEDRNWRDEAYYENVGAKPKTTNSTWLTEEALPKVGVLQLRYFSGAGIDVSSSNHHLHRANVEARRGLMSLVYAQPYCDEDEEYDEEEEEGDKREGAGRSNSNKEQLELLLPSAVRKKKNKSPPTLEIAEAIMERCGANYILNEEAVSIPRPYSTVNNRGTLTTRSDKVSDGKARKSSLSK
jgi:hypothetical protein